MNRSPDMIEKEVEQQRAKVEATLSALQDKLSPGALADQATRFFSDADGGGFANNLGTKVKDNPLPATLAGLGIAWLMLSDRNASQDSERFSDFDERDATAPDHQTQSGSEKNGKTTSKDKTSALGEKVSSATDKAQVASRHYARKAKRGFFETLDEQPMVLGALGIAVGAALGAALPPTRTEDDLVGEAADRAKDAAAEAGKEKLESARETVKAAVTDKKPAA